MHYIIDENLNPNYDAGKLATFSANDRITPIIGETNKTLKKADLVLSCIGMDKDNNCTPLTTSYNFDVLHTLLQQTKGYPKVSNEIAQRRLWLTYKGVKQIQKIAKENLRADSSLQGSSNAAAQWHGVFILAIEWEAYLLSNSDGHIGVHWYIKEN